ncbi:hypothetical protein M405DRAFT_837628 [Rhizopogon salebrosus TDB-379]|nr:hypothetical protein M405DRAFT_837628 [Rhizopogon salebrosus TDB-379]
MDTVLPFMTKGAFSLLDEVFGTFDKASSFKKDYLLPTAKISNPDITRLINSSEIQAVVRPAGPKVQKGPWTQKKNPLVNKGTLRRQELLKQERVKEQKEKKGKKAKGFSAGEAFLDASLFSLDSANGYSKQPPPTSQTIWTPASTH